MKVLLTDRLATVYAVTIVVLWGITFVNTKVLLNAGLSPFDVIFFRTIVAWLTLYPFIPKPIFAKSLHEEFLFVLCGFFGGAAYYLLENCALFYSEPGNVALLVNVAPIATAILSMFVSGTFIKRKTFWFGTLTAFFGVVLIVFKNGFEFNLHVFGDSLAILCAISWAVNSIITKKITQKYQPLFITRKVLFYTIIFVSITFTVEPLSKDTDLLFSPLILGNILFLGLIGQTVCNLLWTLCVKQMGPVKTNNFLYAIPIVTMLTALFVLKDSITWIAVFGSILTIYGVFLSNSALNHLK